MMSQIFKVHFLIFTSMVRTDIVWLSVWFRIFRFCEYTHNMYKYVHFIYKFSKFKERNS